MKEDDFKRKNIKFFVLGFLLLLLVFFSIRAMLSSEEVDISFYQGELAKYQELIELRKDTAISIVGPKANDFYRSSQMTEVVLLERDLSIVDFEIYLIKASDYINYPDWHEVIKIPLSNNGKRNNRWFQKIVPSDYLSGIYVLTARAEDSDGNKYYDQILLGLISAREDNFLEVIFPKEGASLTEPLTISGRFSSDRSVKISSGMKGGNLANEPLNLCEAEIRNQSWECSLNPFMIAPAGEYNLWTLLIDDTGNSKIVELPVRVDSTINLLPLESDEAHIRVGELTKIGILSGGMDLNLESIFLRLSYDPSKVRIVDVKKGALFFQEGVQTEFNYDIGYEEGVIIIGIERRTRVPLNRYGGIMAEIVVEAIPGTRLGMTHIGFLETNLFDSEGNEIIHIARGQNYFIEALR